MKVLLINNGKGWSGGQEHLKDLGLVLRERGVEVHYLVRDETVNVTRFADLGFVVHRTPYRYGPGAIRWFASLVRLLRTERFDIVSINREHDLTVTALAYRLAFPTGKPGRLMMSYHLPTAHPQPLLPLCDAVVCISEHVRRTVLAVAPRVAPRTSIIYYGIPLPPPPDPVKFSLERPRRFFRGRTFPLIGMVGQFWKNQIETIEMLPRLIEVFPQITLALVGDDSDRALVDPLRSRARELGVQDHVVFTGLVTRERLHDVFFDMDVSVTTHRNEGFGIVHLESLAAGTPVIGYDEGGYVDLLRDTGAGILVQGGPDQFVQAVISLLNDHDRRFSLGRAGHASVAERYSLDTMGDSYLRFYEALLQEGRCVSR